MGHTQYIECMNGKQLKAALSELGWNGAELARRMTADEIGRYHRQNINRQVNGRRPVSAAVNAYVTQALRLKDCQDGKAGQSDGSQEQ